MKNNYKTKLFIPDLFTGITLFAPILLIGITLFAPDLAIGITFIGPDCLLGLPGLYYSPEERLGLANILACIQLNL